MKKLYLFLTMFFAYVSIFAQSNETWDLLIQEPSSWQPIVVKNGTINYSFNPMQGTDYIDCECNIDIEALKVKMVGEVWITEDNQTKLKVKGKTAEGLKIMMVGTLSAVNDDYIDFTGNLSLEMMGNGQEIPLSYQLERLPRDKDYNTNSLTDSENSEFESKIVYVNTSSLNMRSKPSTSAKIVAKLPMYSILTCVEFNPENEWQEVSYFNTFTDDYYSGYVNTKFIKRLINDRISEKELAGFWSLLSEKDAGGVTFANKGDYWVGDIRIDTFEEGRSFILISEEVGFSLLNGEISMPESLSYYDSKTGILMFYGFLWKKE